ncbi:hypothetical protein SLEP1_g3239 [Rubroshorea leprosula]|uniref:Ribosomal protein S12 n=1 Tax=Rubroshorea leprosula TaxID=152421 RepID=A0AAV5HJT5_9ROSI|nr:hypothetical protein SLEP1_g3239 [Rubroshorea leprosula]
MPRLPKDRAICIQLKKVGRGSRPTIRDAHIGFTGRKGPCCPGQTQIPLVRCSSLFSSSILPIKRKFWYSITRI